MPNPTPEHQKLVEALIGHFKTNLGYTVLSAAYTGFSEPESHGRHEPDIVATDKDGVLHLAEAKIGQDLYSSLTEEQFKDFSNRVMQNSGKPVIFDVVVYKEDEQKLLGRLNELNLGGLIGNRIKVWTV